MAKKAASKKTKRVRTVKASKKIDALSKKVSANLDKLKKEMKKFETMVGKYEKKHKRKLLPSAAKRKIKDFVKRC